LKQMNIPLMWLRRSCCCSGLTFEVHPGQNLLISGPNGEYLSFSIHFSHFLLTSILFLFHTHTHILSPSQSH
jgi:hypothetical protein